MSARRSRRPHPRTAATLTQLLELPDPVLADYLFGHTPVSDPRLAHSSPQSVATHVRRISHGSHEL